MSGYSRGTAVVMADRQIKRGVENGKVHYDDSAFENENKVKVTFLPTGKWFSISTKEEDNDVHTTMLGAICGDVVGSVYEWHNIKHKPDTERLVQKNARFTDDSVMTCAVAEGLRQGLAKLPPKWMELPESEEVLLKSVCEAMVLYGQKYPLAGYGGKFKRWLFDPKHEPYNSWGNGSAMRASYAGWVAQTLEEAEKLGEISAKTTHNHPEGIKGAKVVAGSIFVLRKNGTKESVKEYVEQYYDLSFSLDKIRDGYSFDVSCAGSVPQAIVAFLEGVDFADVIANAISIGGDSDTIAAIAGSIAEVIYPIPQGLRGRVIDRLDAFLINTIVEAVDYLDGSEGIVETRIHE